MSHAYGEVIHDGKVIAHYEYNGTTDVTISNLRETRKEVTDNWRDAEWLNCTCGQPAIDVMLWTDYGNGFHWPGKVCMNCRAIVEGTDPYGIDEFSYEPEWPKDGHPIPSPKDASDALGNAAR